MKFRILNLFIFQRHPELIIVDSIKDELDEEDAETDSSCDSVQDDLEDETNVEDKTSCDVKLYIKTESESVIGNSASRISKTVTLKTPPSSSKDPINKAITCNDSFSNNDLPKDSMKHVNANKPRRKPSKKLKVCTVCGKLLQFSTERI